MTVYWKARGYRPMSKYRRQSPLYATAKTPPCSAQSSSSDPRAALFYPDSDFAPVHRLRLRWDSSRSNAPQSSRLYQFKSRVFVQRRLAEYEAAGRLERCVLV